MKVLVVSAHPTDYVWRCSGTIANYTEMGHEVRIICLSDGARGESDAAWKHNPGITVEEIIQMRRSESSAAAKFLGASNITFYGWEDHLLDVNRDRMLQLAADMKKYQPDIILSHSYSDPLNADHDLAHRTVMEAMRSANVAGVFPELPIMKKRNLFMFEPNEADLSHFEPAVYIDITDAMEKKKQAMSMMGSQSHLGAGYILRAQYRGQQARKLNGDSHIQYAEAFMALMPQYGKFFHVN